MSVVRQNVQSEWTGFRSRVLTLLLLRYERFFDWRKQGDAGSVTAFANQVPLLPRVSLAKIGSRRRQNISAYSGKTYGEGSQHGLNVEFDLRRFAVAVEQLLKKRGGGGAPPEDL